MTFAGGWVGGVLVQMDSRGRSGSLSTLILLFFNPPPIHLALSCFLPSLFFSSSNNIIHSHQLQHVSKLSSRGKCQWLSDGWKRSGVQIGSRRTCVCVCARVCVGAYAPCAGRWICGYFSCESHQREIITLANLILTK